MASQATGGKVGGFLRSNSRDLIFAGTTFCVAATLRLLFAATSPPPPIAWIHGWIGDEAEYLIAAQAALDVLSSGTDLSQAVAQLGLRGPIYPLYLAVIYGVSGNSHLMVGILQALTDALTCVLIYLIGRRVFGSRPALLAAGSAIIYVPFIQATRNLLRETLASFLLALTVLFLTKAAGTLARKAFLLGGFFLGLTVLCNPAARLLPLVLLMAPVVVVWRRRSRTYLVQVVVVFLLGLAVTVGPWMALTKATMGRALVGASRQGVLAYGGFLNFLDTDGWSVGGGGGTLIREAKRLLMESGGKFSREDLLNAMRSMRFRLQVAGNVIRDTTVPLLVGIPLKNLYRLWTFPYNTFLYSFLFTYPQQVIFHRAIVCLALLGIPVSLTRGWKRSLTMILVLAYFSLSWPLVHIEVRHNMALMPYMMIMAGGALSFLVSVGRGIRASLHRRRIVTTFGIFAGFCVLSLLATLPLLSVVLEQAPLLYMYYLTILVKNGLLLSLVPFLYLLARIRLDRSAAAFVSLFPIVVLLAGYNVQALTSKRWHEWTARLSEPGQRIRQEIVLPDHLEVSRWREGKVLIDMHGGPGKAYDLIVEANGERAVEYCDGLQLPADWFDGYGSFYGGFFRQRLQVQAREPEDLRQWFEIPVDLSLLADTDRIVVEVYFASSSGEPGNYVDIFGDYDWAEDRMYEGPCFALTREETSIYRYVYDDEFRLDCRTRLDSLLSASAFCDGKSWSYEDLSPACGAQSGEFRIRLELRRPGEAIIL